MSSSDSVPALLARALHRIRSTPPRIIASPPTQPRRAAVALLIRVVPPPSALLPNPSDPLPTLSDFFDQDWVHHPDARPEILFLHRHDLSNDPSFANTRIHNTSEAHVAFPGGRMEPDDEGGLYTAMRQTWEEIGIDLAERYYTSVGQLDDREITTSLGKRLLMILSPFVFLQLSPNAPPPDPIQSTSLHWIPLASLVSANPPPRWSTVTVDAASRLTPRNSIALRLLVRILVGSMQFPAIVLDTSKDSASPTIFTKPTSTHDVLEKGSVNKIRTKVPTQLKLWGLSLGMALDLMSYMILPIHQPHSPARPSSPTGDVTDSPLTSVMQLPYRPAGDDFRMEYVAPSLASVFPRFSYPDVNFWIWVFGKRYRSVVRGWEASVRSSGTNDRRINWSGSALSTFYAAIRKALVVVIVVRALSILFGFAFASWWIFWR